MDKAGEVAKGRALDHKPQIRCQDEARNRRDLLAIADPDKLHAHEAAPVGAAPVQDRPEVQSRELRLPGRGRRQGKLALRAGTYDIHLQPRAPEPAASNARKGSRVCWTRQRTASRSVA